MRKRSTKQGLFQRAIMALLALVILAVPVAAHAISFDDLAKSEGQLSTNDITEQLGLSEETDCQLNPANPGDITKESAKKLSIQAGGITFTLDHAYFRNRNGASESFDYVFTPQQGDQRLDQPAFDYRTGEKAKSNAFIVGVDNAGVPVDGGDGYELDSNLVAGRCANFNDSAFAKALDAAAKEDNLDSFNVAGRDSVSTDTNAFSSGSDTDPFTLAVQKITEVLVSLNQSMVSALTTVMDLGNITEVKGLTTAWSTVRDLINLLFLVVLAALAVLTIIRVDVRSYDVRKSLPLLIFAVIGVNFALLMATIMVNTAFVLAQPFMNKATAIVESTALNNPASNGAGADFGTSVVLLFASLIMLIGLAVLLFFFVIRIIVVWILAALSPVVFLFMVLPLTRGESLNLLQTWIKWVYMAPIAFLILYIGSAMLLPAFGNGGGSDSGASAILSAIFYAGVLAAAVLIPYGLGGSIMGRIGAKGLGAVGAGARGGLRATDMIPLGNRMSVGEARRTAKGFFKAREAAQEDRAQERAVAGSEQLYSFLGQGGLASSLTGLDATRAQQYRDQLVDKEQKNQMLGGLGADGAMRVVQYRNGQIPASQLSSEEMAIANDRIGELAAWKTVVDSNFVDPRGPELARYAKFGLHRNSADPLVAAVQKTYRGGDLGAHLDQETLQYGLKYADADTIGKIPGTFWSVVGDSSFASSNPTAAKVLHKEVKHSLNPSGIQKAMDNTDRGRAYLAKREAMGKVYEYFGDDVKRAVDQANMKSYRDAEQHVALGTKSAEDLAKEYKARGGK
jgi:hypothetical protein